MNTTKDFKEHFWMLLNKLKAGEYWSMCRFSDGELFIMQNKKLVLSSDHIQIGNNLKKGVGYQKVDHKEFIPERDVFYRQKLIDSFQYKSPGYYKGISCKCCVGEIDYKWQIDLHGGDDDSLTWSNLWVNSNYPLFREKFVPELSKHKNIIICNEKSKVRNLPFPIEKDFRVGYNCIINDFPLVEKLTEWTIDNNIKNKVFLFSASSLSNFLIHNLWKEWPYNWYIDIGTCLNPYLKLPIQRGYLTYYSRGELNKGTLAKTCIW